MKQFLAKETKLLASKYTLKCSRRASRLRLVVLLKKLPSRSGLHFVPRQAEHSNGLLHLSFLSNLDAGPLSCEEAPSARAWRTPAIPPGSPCARSPPALPSRSRFHAPGTP